MKKEKKPDIQSRIFNKFLKLTLGNLLKWKYNIRSDNKSISNLEPPYIVLPNHVTFWDPFMVSIFVKDPVHYVANDEYFRNLILRVLLKLVGAIPKTKFRSDSETVKAILRIKQKKGVIGIYPEGTRNWTGETLPILYPTAKLIKTLKIPVVTAVIKGGCLSKPRWAKKSRRGKMFIDYRILLTNDDVKSMSVDEIYQAIEKGLAFSEYDFQRENMIRYKGRKLAENLELFLFACPQCNSLGSMKSSGNRFGCRKCGYSTIYNEYGFFEKQDGGLIFDNPADWDKWQLDYLDRYINAAIESSDKKGLLADNNVILKIGARLVPLKTFRFGKITLFGDRVTFSSYLREEFDFYIDKIRGLNVQSNNKFEFYYQGKLYRFNFKLADISSYKWVSAIECVSRRLNRINNNNGLKA